MRIVSATPLAAERPRPFLLFAGCARSVVFFANLPPSVWRWLLPPMGGKAICLGLDYTAVIALLDAYYPTLTLGKKRRLLSDLNHLAVFSIHSEDKRQS